MTKFDSDRIKGEEIERRVAFHLARKWNSLIRPNPPGRVKSHDFTLMVPMLVEVKADWESANTGNVFFETYNNQLREPSGMAATKAKWWIQFLPMNESILLFQPKKMLHWLEEESELLLCRTAGDNGNSSGYIVEIQVAEELEFVTVELI